MSQEKKYSRSAADHAHYLRNKVTVHTCIVCNSTFIANHKRKYCSDQCNPNITLFDKATRRCKTCLNSYIPRVSKQKYCSRKCNPYGKKYTDPFYQTKEWKIIRSSFIASYTLINGIRLSNKYCIECYIRQNRLNDMYAVDHIVRRVDGGSDEHCNLQSLCKSHHQSKSALEGNRERFFFKR